MILSGLSHGFDLLCAPRLEVSLCLDIHIARAGVVLRMGCADAKDGYIYK